MMVNALKYIFGMIVIYLETLSTDMYLLSDSEQWAKNVNFDCIVLIDQLHVRT